jgi:hypothetical protein
VKVSRVTCATHNPLQNRLRQRIAISADAFGRRVKAVEDVVARANVVVLAELASNTSTEP